MLLSGAIPHLLKDINLIPTRPTGHIENITVVGNEVFFTAFDAGSGIELWKSDGTVGGTTIVKDIRPGADSSAPSNLVDVEGTLFFAANDGATGVELWKSDGTEAGTVLVKNIRVPVPPTVPDPNPPDLSSSPNSIVEAGGVAYFQANDGLTGAELWRSDGTEAGTFLVADINSGFAPNGTPLSSSPRNMIEFNDQVVFRADDGVTGIELYKSDGFSYSQIMDINLGSGSSVDSRFAIVNSSGTLYFTARSSTSGFELWKTSGTEATTVLIDADHVGAPGAGILPGSGSAIPATPQLVSDGNGGVYFTASNGTLGFEPWHTNGVIADQNGTFMMKDVFAGSGSSNPTGFTVVGGAVFFAATNGTQNVYNVLPYNKYGTELWKSDGFNSNNGGTTELVKNIRPDPVPTDTIITRATLNSDPANLIAMNGKLYFTANDGDHGIELWTSDGTDAGTFMLENIRPEPLSNDDHPASPSSTPSTFVTTNGLLFFQADDGTTGGELWVSDGIADTHLVANIYPGTDNLSFENNPSRFANVNGTLYFTGTFGNGSFGLFMTDGTTIGTQLLMDAELLPTSTTSPAKPILNLTAVGNTLFFSAWDPVRGYELWKAEGAVVSFVANIRPEALPTEQVPNPPPLDSNPANFFSYDGKLIFTANNGTTGTEIWSSDGTPEGTVPVGDLWVGSGSSNPSQFTIVGTNLFFVASSSTSGFELWKYTGSGTPTLVNDSNQGLSNGLDPSNSYLTNVGGTLYYRGSNGPNGWELWASNGEPNGTFEVSNINPGAASSNPIYITNLNGVAYFYADDGVHGNELWRSGGSSQTTQLVMDINTTLGPIIPNPNPQGPPLQTTFGSSDTSLFLIVFNNKLYFTANNGSTEVGSVGTELWVTDGNTDPTRFSLTEINASKGITYYSRPTIYNNALYFIVDDGIHGRELYFTDGLAAPSMLYDVRLGVTGSFDSISPIMAAGDYLYFIANDGIHGAEVWTYNNTDTTSPTTIATYEFTTNTIKIVFSEDVSDSIQASDVKVQLQPGGPIFNPDSFTYDIGTNTATFKFLAPLPNGNYKFTVAAADVTDDSANPLAAPINGEFFTLGGDANRDRKVDAYDLQILAAHWQSTSGVDFSTADFNFDGKVDNFDLYILATNYGSTLPAPAPPAVPVSTPVRSPVKRVPTRSVALVDTVATR